MMAWISVHEDVIGSKLRKLAREIGCSQAEALGILNVLWLWGLKNADQSGEIRDADKRDVASAIPAAMLSEDLQPEGIVDALIETGWIDDMDGTLFLHDWDEWQEQWYKFLGKKAYDAQRKREERRRKKEAAQASGGVPAIPPDAAPQCALPQEPKPQSKPRAQSEKKEPEKKKYADFVRMKESEYEKLVQNYGREAADKMIEVLDNYKGSKGKTYKDDYRAILNWVVDRIQDKYPGLIRRPPAAGSGGNPWEGYGGEA